MFRIVFSSNTKKITFGSLPLYLKENVTLHSITIEPNNLNVVIAHSMGSRVEAKLDYGKRYC
jgi:hypothetical protein